MLIFDAHLDISMNAVEWNRDLTLSIDQVRDREMGKIDYLDRGKGVLTLEEMRKGEIGLCIATQIARYVAPGNTLTGWHSPEIAWSITQAQLALSGATDRAEREHHQIFEACKAGNTDEAVELLADHIQSSADSLMECLRKARE